MLILKLKQNGFIYKDQLGNEYPDIVIALSRREDPCSMTMTVDLKYFKDEASITTNQPVLVDSFYWTKDAVTPMDVDNNPIDWAVFMTTVPREEWKDRIKDIGRVAFSDLDIGLTVTITQGLDFKENQVGQAWKEIMLFLPVHRSYGIQSGTKFLDENFEYAII
jgi:hypothetical protein